VTDGITNTATDVSAQASATSGEATRDEAAQANATSGEATRDEAAQASATQKDASQDNALPEGEMRIGDFKFRFAQEVEPAYYYASIYPSTASPLACLTGALTAAKDTSLAQAPTGFTAFTEFLTGIDYRPFWVSLRTSAVAMVFIFALGLLAARLSLRMNNRFKGLLDSIFTIPMVLPPTVCGFILLVLFGNTTAVGRWLIANGIELVFTWPAAVIAAVVVGFPLMYRTTRGAFESQDPALFDAARTLGWGESRIFIRLMLPLAWPSIAAGTVLAFARAMGEFGATLFVAGNYAGVTQTMPIAIYFQWMGGHSDIATFWVIVVVLMSFLIILIINWYAARSQVYRRKSGKKINVEKCQALPDAHCDEHLAAIGRQSSSVDDQNTSSSAAIGRQSSSVDDQSTSSNEHQGVRKQSLCEPQSAKDSASASFATLSNKPGEKSSGSNS
jgi:molybdate ABC transporter permease protein